MENIGLSQRAYVGAPQGFSRVNLSNITTSRKSNWAFCPPDKRNKANRSRVIARDTKGHFVKYQ